MLSWAACTHSMDTREANDSNNPWDRVTNKARRLGLPVQARGQLSKGCFAGRSDTRIFWYCLG